MGRRVVSTRRMAARVSWVQGRTSGPAFTAEVILWAVRWYLMSRSERRFVACDRLVEVPRRRVDERLVDPAFFGDVGQPGVEQRKICPRVDGKVHHPVLAGLDLASIDSHGASRIDDDNPCVVRLGSFGNSAFFLSMEVPRRFGTQWFRK